MDDGRSYARRGTACRLDAFGWGFGAGHHDRCAATAHRACRRGRDRRAGRRAIRDRQDQRRGRHPRPQDQHPLRRQPGQAGRRRSVLQQAGRSARRAGDHDGVLVGLASRSRRSRPARNSRDQPGRTVQPVGECVALSPEHHSAGQRRDHRAGEVSRQQARQEDCRYRLRERRRRHRRQR